MTWLLFTNIITKCFTSLLLTSYFRQISVPLIETLEQLVEQDDIFIAANENTLEFIDDSEKFNKKQISLLYQKKRKYKMRLEFDFNYILDIFDKKIFNDMVNGLSVILLNGFDADVFKAQYISENDKYFISDTKYFHQFGTHWIHKNSSILAHLFFV